LGKVGKPNGVKRGGTREGSKMERGKRDKRKTSTSGSYRKRAGSLPSLTPWGNGRGVANGGVPSLPQKLLIRSRKGRVQGRWPLGM